MQLEKRKSWKRDLLLHQTIDNTEYCNAWVLSHPDSCPAEVQLLSGSRLLLCTFDVSIYASFENIHLWVMHRK